MEHDKETCEFCQAVATMEQIMALVEAMPVWDVPLFDDAVTAVFNAADEAQSVLRCWAVDREKEGTDDERT